MRQGFDSLTTRVSDAATEANNAYLQTWTSIKDGAIRGIATAVADARTALSNAANTAGRLLGGLGSAVMSLLPGWATSFIRDIPAKVNSVVAAVQTTAQRVTAAASAARDTAFNLAKAFVDAKLREFAAQKQAAERLISGARDLARQPGTRCWASSPHRSRISPRVSPQAPRLKPTGSSARPTRSAPKCATAPAWCSVPPRVPAYAAPA